MHCPNREETISESNMVRNNIKKRKLYISQLTTSIHPIKNHLTSQKKRAGIGGAIMNMYSFEGGGEEVGPRRNASSLGSTRA